MSEKNKEPLPFLAGIQFIEKSREKTDRFYGIILGVIIGVFGNMFVSHVYGFMIEFFPVRETRISFNLLMSLGYFVLFIYFIRKNMQLINKEKKLQDDVFEELRKSIAKEEASSENDEQKGEEKP